MRDEIKGDERVGRRGRRRKKEGGERGRERRKKKEGGRERREGGREGEGGGRRRGEKKERGSLVPRLVQFFKLAWERGWDEEGRSGEE